MGYNTTVFILNDCFHEIQKDPKAFVDHINQTMHSGGDFSVGRFSNYCTVMKTEHADVPRLYSTEANLIVELSQYSRETLDLARKNDWCRDVVLSRIDWAQRELKALKKAVMEERDV